MEEKRIAMKEMVHSIATSHFATSPSLPTPEDPKKDMSVLITEPQTEEWVPTDAPYSPSHPLVSLAGAAPEQESYALEVLRLFDADYGLIVVEGMRRLLGNADSSEVVFLAAFEQYVAKNNLAQILSSHNIAKTLPGALPVAEGYNTSGVLYVPLSLDASSYLALFRYEQVAHVKWAGAPQKTVDKHPITNQPALMPRTSFHIWTEEVRGSSREWTELEIETAHSLFVNLMELMRLIRLRVRMVEETIARQKIEQEKHMAEASNKMKSQFLANLSHEVRTPLNAILGMVDLTLSTTKVDPTQANYLAAVQHASESLLLIINDLLDISKIEAGKLVLVNDTFEFVKLIEQTVSAYKLSIERKGVTFRLEIDSSISDVISTDSVRLCQVLTNLLSNAKKYTITGSIEMRVSCVPCLTEVPNLKPSPRLLLQPHTPPTSLSNAEEEKEEAKEKAKGKGKGKEKAEDGETKEKEEEFIPETIFLHFSISDTGVGIPQEKIDSVFEPFEQVDSQLTRKVGGTGLGLSICRRIVRLMGGQLWCESLVNHGSTFRFEIPVETGPRRRTVDGSAAPPRNGTDFLNLTAGTIFPRPADATNPEPEVNATEDEIPKVLVVEDNTLNQKVAVNFLRRLNLASEVAGNGEIAVNLYRDHPHRYGAILMDICMPVKDGLVASSEIRAFEMLVAGGRSPRLYHANIALGEAESSSETRSKSSNFRRVPIVALSAQVMDQDRDACMNAGMDGFLEKPVRFENLKRLLTPIFAQYPKWQNPDAK